MANPIPVNGWYIDTRKAVALANQMKSEAARAYIAIQYANTRLAIQVQRAEARELRKQVAGHSRPQRHGPTSGKGLARVLLDERNRTVSPTGFTVNDPAFLDTAAIYWRQLEHGAQGRTQLLTGLFAEPARSVNPRSRYATVGGVAPPIPGDRSAHRFLRYEVSRKGRRAPRFLALVGPADPYRYIATSRRDIRRAWAVNNSPANTYKRAFHAQGLSLLAQFRAVHGRALGGFGDLGE